MNKKKKKTTEQRKSIERKKSTSSAYSLESQAVSVYTYVTCKPYNDMASQTIKDQEKVTRAKANLKACYQRTSQMQALAMAPNSL